MNFEIWLKQECPAVTLHSAQAVLALTKEGATLPFIARYRKEKTGGLDEVSIQAVLDARAKWDDVTKRQAYILEEIEKQGKLSDELKKTIAETFSLEKLEDIYLPFKQKRKTKASLAREAGLDILADWIWDVGHQLRTPEPGQTLAIWALAFINDEKGYKDVDAVIAGAGDIITERLSENATLRQNVRDTLFQHAFITTAKGKKAKDHSKFEPYFEFQESVSSLLKPENSHRYLALKRGWIEEELTLSFSSKQGETPLEESLLTVFMMEACTDQKSDCAPVLYKCARLALKVYVLPSIESEVHRALHDIADQAAIRVFAENVKTLLLASPFGSKAVLGVDPGIRTGCKVAVVDDAGQFIADTVLHLQTPDGKERAKAMILEAISKCRIKAIAVGNGTAGRETEAYLKSVLSEARIQIPVVMVNESGASIYSASPIAREEFPNLDVTVRGAISIARRLQDPLAELVKIDPKSIGVGQYQHDVSQPALKKNLDFVVDVCVNSVGVNLNTASYHLLSRVAGIGPALAKTIVATRSEKGLFKSKQDLLCVSRFSEKTLEQSAGFLRIPQGNHPLDNTGVHPERYAALEELATKMGCKLTDLMGAEGIKKIQSSPHAKALQETLGLFTYEDVLKELEKPGRDPREAFAAFSFRDDIFELRDLKKDMLCPGIVTNVTNFGAFVDIGVHQDGLVHISELSYQFVKDPRQIVNPGDKVTVRVIDVNMDKRQIALSMKLKDDAKQVKETRPGSRPVQHSKHGKQPNPPTGKPLTHSPFQALANFKKK